MANVNDEEIQIDDAPLSVGVRLKKAREEKKFSIAEVSAQLRLMKENINALEAGQWEKLHGRAYARGYFTSYIKLLGLDEQEFLAAFNREYKSSASEATLSNVARIDEPKKLPWGRLLLIVFLLTATWFAYQQWLFMEADSNFEVSDPSSEIEPITNNLFNESVVEPITTPIEATRETEMAVSPEDANSISEVDDAVTSETTAASNIAEEGINEVLATEVTVAEVPPETYIALQFSEDCWVKISDVDSQVLINKLMKANTRLELSGKTPLNVSLGRASAVSIQVNDKEFDLAAHTQGDVAKFTLEDDS